ncbi:hypothetical protein KC953_02990 [Candidatus Saccharibacteria bacterium]|nr:hypothetical protein [Candidatus Saccharibacteria bacterium]
MDRSGLQRLVPIFLVCIVIVLAVAALVSLGRTLFGGNIQVEAPVNSGMQELTSTLADRSVRMSVRGPIVARENYYTYKITISPDARNMTTYHGYLGDEAESMQMQNDAQAYGQFVHALAYANMMNGVPLSKEADDTTGICASGYLYEFEVRQGDNSVQRLWTTTCGGSLGSLKANLSQVVGLFRQQIPEYSKLLRKINF